MSNKASDDCTLTYYPVWSTASALTGPLWHNILTSGVPMFGLHSVTTPRRGLDLHCQIRQLRSLTCVVTEVQDSIARVLSHHVARTQVSAEISDDGTCGSVLVVQTAALVLIRKVSELNMTKKSSIGINTKLARGKVIICHSIAITIMYLRCWPIRSDKARIRVARAQGGFWVDGSRHLACHIYTQTASGRRRTSSHYATCCE